MDVFQVFRGQQVQVVDDLLLGDCSLVKGFVFLLHHGGKVLASLVSDLFLDHSGFEGFVFTDDDFQTRVLLDEFWHGFGLLVELTASAESLLLLIFASPLLSVVSVLVVILSVLLLRLFGFFFKRGFSLGPAVDFVDFVDDLLVDKLLVLIRPFIDEIVNFLE